jgi:hypothetical protein
MPGRLIPAGVVWLLPTVLSTTGGAVDVIGFLALGGLFSAHITGNVVVVAAHYVTGGFGEVGPLLAVPVFVAVLGAVTLVSVEAEKAGNGSRRALLASRQPSWQAAWAWRSGSAHSPTPTPRWQCASACSRSPQWPPRMRWSSSLSRAPPPRQ